MQGAKNLQEGADAGERVQQERSIESIQCMLASIFFGLPQPGRLPAVKLLFP
jgi:hypothetical protein